MHIPADVNNGSEGKRAAWLAIGFMLVITTGHEVIVLDDESSLLSFAHPV
jgi:hypothetical protein